MKKICNFCFVFLLLCNLSTKAQEITIEQILWSADWSPNGKWIAIGGNDNTLHIYSGESFEPLKTFSIPNTITQLSWHPSRPLLAIATQISPEKPSVLDFSTGKFFYLNEVSDAGGRCIAWDATGELLAVGDNAGDIVIFDRSGSFIRKIPTNQRAITGLDWHPEKSLLAVVGAHVSLYNFDKNKLKEVEARHVPILMLSVQWHPSGKYFVTGDYGNSEAEHLPWLQFWSATGHKIRNIDLSVTELRGLSWSNDGKLLSSASDVLRIWNKNGKLLLTGESKGQLWGIAWNPNGTKIVTSTENGMMYIWDRSADLIKEIKVNPITKQGSPAGAGEQR